MIDFRSLYLDGVLLLMGAVHALVGYNAIFNFEKMAMSLFHPAAVKHIMASPIGRYDAIPENGVLYLMCTFLSFAAVFVFQSPLDKLMVAVALTVKSVYHFIGQVQWYMEPGQPRYNDMIKDTNTGFTFVVANGTFSALLLSAVALNAF